MSDNFYLFMINGLMMPVRVISKREFMVDPLSDDYKRPKRFVRYKYVKVTHDKQLTYAEGKVRASVFKKFAAKISEKEYEEKLLTLRTLYGNKDGEIYNNESYEWTTGD